MGEPLNRRDFLKQLGRVGATAIVSQIFPPPNASAEQQKQQSEPTWEEEKQAILSRKEKFQPFNRGNAEWEYVTFQYDDVANQKIGVTLSMSELTDPSNGKKIHHLLVMKHYLATKTTESFTYNGTRSFSPTRSTYSFKDKSGSELASFSYHENDDNYKIQVRTTQFNSDSLDPDGLTLSPVGDLMAVSKDGNFPVAKYDGGKLVTNYYADHVEVRKQDGTTIGFGRRDSENLEIEGVMPSTVIDVDHTWVHTTVELANGNRAHITAWECKTGGDFKFADITIVNPTTRKVESFTSRNEEDADFTLDFIPSASESERIPSQSPTSREMMTHGGKVIAKSGSQILFEIDVDGNPGQFIDGKGILQMVEAHGTSTGSVFGVSINTSDSAIWETTNESHFLFLPLVLR